MAHYYPVKLEEMENFLRAEKGWRKETQGNEFLFSYKLKAAPRIEIKVFTGIRTDTAQSRKVGADSIKVCAVDVVKHQGFIKARRIHRTFGWKNNLQDRVMQVIRQSNARLRTN